MVLFGSIITYWYVYIYESVILPICQRCPSRISGQSLFFFKSTIACCRVLTLYCIFTPWLVVSDLYGMDVWSCETWLDFTMNMCCHGVLMQRSIKSPVSPQSPLPPSPFFFFVSATIHSISWGGQGLRYRGWTGVEGDWRVWGNVMNSTRSPDCTLFINNRWGDSDNITIMMDMEPALMTILSELCGEMYVDKKPLMLSILSLSLHRGLLA